jgi:hypothetical protein
MSSNSAAESSALRSLSESYARGIDRRDRELYVGPFLAVGQVVIHQPAQSGENANAKTDRVLGQSTYEVEGDHAGGEVDCIAHHLTPDHHGGTNHVMCNRHEDVHRRHEGRWGIETRRVRGDWTEVRAATSERPA